MLFSHLQVERHVKPPPPSKATFTLSPNNYLPKSYNLSFPKYLTSRNRSGLKDGTIINTYSKQFEIYQLWN